MVEQTRLQTLDDNVKAMQDTTNSLPLGDQKAIVVDHKDVGSGYGDASSSMGRHKPVDELSSSLVTSDVISTVASSTPDVLPYSSISYNALVGNFRSLLYDSPVPFMGDKTPIVQSAQLNCLRHLGHTQGVDGIFRLELVTSLSHSHASYSSDM
ncbi:hypothetical protein V6N11_075099 [Hibiscus sabdariffa]|uniref:Uncharacterized protein n=1 Tax=Hibiscus sabdariffa TaxID=183260 RepID=A0ABR2R657_9ROSI